MSSLRGGRGGFRGRGLPSAGGLVTTEGRGDAKIPRGPSKPRGRDDNHVRFNGVGRGASSTPRGGARGGRGDGARRAREEGARGRGSATTTTTTTTSHGITPPRRKTPPRSTHGSDPASYSDRFQAVRRS